MLVTNNDELAEKLRVLRLHGAKPKYHHKYVGINSRLDTIQAAILRVKLPYLNDWSELRQNHAKTYVDLFKEKSLIAPSLADLSEKNLLPPPNVYGKTEDASKHIYHQFVIRVKKRDELQLFLKERHIGTAIYYPVPLHEQECFEGLGYTANDCPNASLAAKETLALPMFPELELPQQKFVVDCIAEFLQNRS
jgi:dTDP-4-amino-4,6-dideoxygalactose transaminase